MPQNPIAVTLQSAVAASGNGNAMDVLGFPVVAVQVTGTFSATLTFEGTVDGTNWIAIPGANIGTAAAAPTATTAAEAGIYMCNVAGLRSFRARISVYSSGTITAVAIASTIAGGVAAATPAVAVTPAGEQHIGEVGGNLVVVSAELTRTSDTNAYAANDVVSDSVSATTMIAVAGCARTSGIGGYIVGIRIATDKKSITPRLRLHFFNTNGATVAADNANWTDTYADSSKRVGYWDMPAMSTGADATNSNMSRTLDMTPRIPYTCAATSLYYVIETLDAFTPASAQKFNVTLFLDRN